MVSGAQRNINNLGGAAHGRQSNACQGAHEERTMERQGALRDELINPRAALAVWRAPSL